MARGQEKRKEVSNKIRMYNLGTLDHQRQKDPWKDDAAQPPTVTDGSLGPETGMD